MQSDFELVVLGATGLTGKLVVEQLAHRDALLPISEKRRWSVAGRDLTRLAQVLADLQIKDVDPIKANLDDKASLIQLAMRTFVVLSCAGPYSSQAEGFFFIQSLPLPRSDLVED